MFKKGDAARWRWWIEVGVMLTLGEITQFPRLLTGTLGAVWNHSCSSVKPSKEDAIINFDLIYLACVLAYLIIITLLLCFKPVLRYIYQQNKPLINPIHLSKKVLIFEPVSEEQNVSMPALLRAPPQVLSDSQSQVPRIMTEPQQVGLVCPHLRQTCWRCG